MRLIRPWASIGTGILGLALLGIAPAPAMAVADLHTDLTQVTWSNGKVAIYWTDRSTNEDRFRVDRINWTTRTISSLYDVPTRDKLGSGGTYLVPDLDPITPSQDGEVCYKIYAHDSPDAKVGLVSNQRCLSVPSGTPTPKPAAPTTTTAAPHPSQQTG